MIKKLILSTVFGISALTGLQSQTVKQPLWMAPTNGDSGWNSPTLGPDGTIYQGDISGKLHAINPDGSSKWVKQVGTNLSGGSAVLTSDGSKIYIAESTSPGKVFCLNSNDGSEIWNFVIPAPTHLTTTPEPGQQLGGGCNSPCALSHDEGTIYFGTGNWMECNPCSEDIFDDRLIALDVSGSVPVLKWEFKSTLEDPMHNVRASFWAAPSIADDGTIYAGNFNNHLYHLQDNGTSFTVLHKRDFVATNPMPTTPMGTGEPGEEAEMWSNHAIDTDGTIFTQANNGFGYALNPDLTTKWYVPFLLNDTLYDNFISPVLTPNGLVIMAAENGYIYGLDKTNGTEVWKFPNTPTPAEEWWRFCTVNQNGICILGSEKSGKYFAIDANTGLQVWETPEIGLETGSCPAIADDGTIYVTGGYFGDLYAFDGGAPLADTPWPKAYHNNKNQCRRPWGSVDVEEWDIEPIQSFEVLVNAEHQYIEVVLSEFPADADAVNIIDMQGRVVLSEMAQNRVQRMDLSSFDAGTYIIQYRTKTGASARKIILR